MDIRGNEGKNSFQGSDESPKIDVPFGVPVELAFEIFKHLDMRDIESLSRVSKETNKIAIGSTNSRESLKVKKFLKFLTRKLLNEFSGKYHTQIATIQSIFVSKNIFDGVNLQDLQRDIPAKKEEIFNVLKTIERNDLDKLEELFNKEGLEIPTTYENLFKLAKIYGNIDRLNAVPKDYLQSLESKKVVYELFEIEKYGQAIDLAKSIDFRMEQIEAFDFLIEKFIKLGKFDLAMQIALLNNSSVSYKLLFKAIITRDGSDQLIKLLETSNISSQNVRWRAFSALGYELIEKCEYKAYNNIKKNIHSNDHKELVDGIVIKYYCKSPEDLSDGLLKEFDQNLHLFLDQARNKEFNKSLGQWMGPFSAENVELTNFQKDTFVSFKEGRSLLRIIEKGLVNSGKAQWIDESGESPRIEFVGENTSSEESKEEDANKSLREAYNEAVQAFQRAQIIEIL